MSKRVYVIVTFGPLKPCYWARRGDAPWSENLQDARCYNTRTNAEAAVIAFDGDRVLEAELSGSEDAPVLALVNPPSWA